MADYKIGALSSLICGNEEPVKALFRAEKKQVVVATPIARCDKTPRGTRGGVKKRRQPRTPSSTPVDSLRKIKVDSDNSESDDENAATTSYSQPSRRFQVGNEEKNRHRNRDTEKEGRTVFVGNLPKEMTSLGVKRLFRPFGNIEAVRLRGAARPDEKTTKKVAVIKQTFNDKRDNILAYVRYSTLTEAEASLSLNGTCVDGHTIRVDLAWHADKPTSHDQSKAVFVGNLGFSVGEDAVRSHFERCGPISDVRIVRDSKTGMGKGFCYVNFVKADGVEMAAGLMDGTELNGRKLRVSRSTSRPKKVVAVATNVKTRGAFGVISGSQRKIIGTKKVNKKTLQPSFEGKKADATRPSKVRKPKKFDRGERKKKINAKKMKGNA